MKEKKKSYAEIARLCGKNESSIRGVMKNREKMIVFLFHRRLQKVTAIARDKVLMKEKVLNFRVEDMNRKRITLFITFHYYFI